MLKQERRRNTVSFTSSWPSWSNIKHVYALAICLHIYVRIIASSEKSAERQTPHDRRSDTACHTRCAIQERVVQSIVAVYCYNLNDALLSASTQHAFRGLQPNTTNFTK